jgi:hypothetical protein
MKNKSIKCLTLGVLATLSLGLFSCGGQDNTQDVKNNNPQSQEVVNSETSNKIVFEFGANGEEKHWDGSELKEDYTETVGDYTLTLTNLSKVYSKAFDAKGNSCLKLGTSSKGASLTFTVPEDITSVVINIASYKKYTNVFSLNGGEQTEIAHMSDDGEYDAVTVDTSKNKTITLTTPDKSGDHTQGRAMINSIEFKK